MLSKSVYNKMVEVEDRHWWYRSLYDLIFCAIKEKFDGQNIFIIDVGCGTGGNMKFLINKGYKNIRGFDISDYAIEICRSNKLDTFVEDINNFNKHFAPKSLDVVICNDVFCYFSENERRKIADSFYTSLKDSGIVILNLPSLNIFSGINDIAFDVKHRISRKDINGIFDKRKFGIIKVLYWSFLLTPVILTIRTYQRIKMRLARNISIEPDIYLPSKYINRFLYKVVQFENRFIKYKPFGSSLFIVAKRLNS